MKNERNSLPLLKKILLTIISIVILLMQIAFYYFLIVASRDVTWLNVTMKIIGVICVINMFNNDTMCSTYKLIWTIIILFFSFAGPLLYLLLGNQRSMPKRKNQKVQNYLSHHMPENKEMDELEKIDPTGYRFVKMVNTSTKFPVYRNTKVDFYSDIEKKFQTVIEDMKKAKKYIYIEMFIIATGKMLDEVIKVLEEKSQENIEIKILYDDVGSKVLLKKETYKRLENIKNLKIKNYEPLGLSINPAVNFRDHRKIIIIDGKIGYVGGDNISDEYANWVTKYGKWRDNALRIEGDAVDSLLVMFSETWFMSSKEMIDIDEKKQVKTEYASESFVFPYSDGPTDDINPAYDLYSSMTLNAQKYLYISTPYLAIDDGFIDNIVNACKSGVDVRILVPGIPDKKIVYQITKSFYGKILKAGGKIYEYTPGFNHAKNYICDDKYAIVGTINVDYRSLYLHFENAILLINDQTINEMKNNFLEDLSQSKEIKYEEWNKRPIFSKILQFILRIFSPLI